MLFIYFRINTEANQNDTEYIWERRNTSTLGTLYIIEINVTFNIYEERS